MMAHNHKNIEVKLDGKSILTPAKKPFFVPTQALANAITAEWKANPKYTSQKMPLTSLAFTAIDRIAGQEAAIVEALLVYLDTDTLCYRAGEAEPLLAIQQAKWDPILAWAEKRFDAGWRATNDIMPADQSPVLHKAIGNYLRSLDSMSLAAGCILSSCCSSLALAIAVLEKHITPLESFALSRLEEEFQAERWGRDEEAEQKAARVKQEIVSAGQFLSLLDQQ